MTPPNDVRQAEAGASRSLIAAQSVAADPGALDRAGHFVASVLAVARPAAAALPFAAEPAHALSALDRSAQRP